MKRIKALMALVLGDYAWYEILSAKQSCIPCLTLCYEKPSNTSPHLYPSTGPKFCGGGGTNFNNYKKILSKIIFKQY